MSASSWVCWVDVVIDPLDSLSSKGCFSQLYDSRGVSPSTWTRSCGKKLVCRWLRDEGKSRCEFCGHGSGIRGEWKCQQGYFLAVFNRRYQTHQFGRAQCDDKGFEFGPSMAGITITSHHGLHIHLSMDFRHLNQEYRHKHKVFGKMLARWQLETLWELVDEYGLTMAVTLQQRWLKLHREETKPM